MFAAGCGESKELGDAGFIKGFIGGVATDEPRAALVGKEILGRGGSAADAATAMFFTMTVTKPSAASLGAVGSCLYYDAPNKSFAAFDFMPPAKAPTPGAPPNIAPPAAVRGMAAMQARYGALRWAELVGPAETLARIGHAASRSLATDLADHGERLARDPGMRAVFGRPDGGFVREGDQVEQLDLAATLSQIRQKGAGALFTGPLSRAYADAAKRIGGALDLATLRDYAPRALEPILRPAGASRIAFMPTYNSNGPQQARLWRILAEEGALSGAARDARLHVIAEAAVLAHAEFAAAARTPGADLETLDEQAIDRLDARFEAFDPAKAQSIATWLGGVQPIPTETSGTSLVAVDRTGSAAACGFTLFRAFGTGRLLPGIGAPAALLPPPGVISSAMGPIVVGNTNIQNFYLALAGSGASASTTLVTIAARTILGDEAINAAVGAPRHSRSGGVATAAVEADVGADARAALVARGYELEESEPMGRINAAACLNGLRNDADGCDLRTDWRGHGLAASSR